MRLIKLAFGFYILNVIALFLYSFTQVDLSLTLSQAPVIQNFVKSLQSIGFYNRPLSVSIFIAIEIIFFLFYLLFLKWSKDKLKAKPVFILLTSTVGILIFSYNAFSYDLFNYIFDAKILTFYHQNPYLFKPLDFVNDPMLSFMRWTHRVYPYGPTWLVLTVPISFIGSNIFSLTLLLFKIMMGFSFLGSSYLIYKISEVIDPKNKIFNTVFWSFNPFVILEGLVSAHNDFPLVFFALLSIYLYLIKKKLISFASLLFSIGIKYFSIILVPFFLAAFYLERVKKKINWDNLFILSLFLSLAGVVLASQRSTFQPWYLIFPLSLASLISKKLYVLIPSIIAAFTCVLVYCVYVFITDYAQDYTKIITAIELFGFGIALLSAIATISIKKYR